MLSILVFLIVLSVLVGVHELGHFLAAKACGIYVDRFSIGMPPRVFGFQWGETDYCIGALPIGGFVKMAGQEDAPLSDEEREKDYGHIPSDRWFNNKPVWQRFIVLIAGPAMNVLLAVVLYAIIVGIGSDVPEFEVSSRLGEIAKDSPAASAPLWKMDEQGNVDFSRAPDFTGMQTGDTVVTLDGNPVKNIQDLIFAAILEGTSKEHVFVLERENAEGVVERFASRLKPAMLDKEDEFPRFGVSPYMTPVVGEVLPDMPALAAGIEEGDIILRANGVIVDQVTFVNLVEKVPEGETLALDILRGNTRLKVDLTPMTIGRLTKLSVGAGEKGEDADPKLSVPQVLAVDKEFREKTGLRPKDVIRKVNGENATLEVLQKKTVENPNKTLSLEVERPRVMFGLIQQAESLTIEVPVDAVRAIGVVHKPRMVFHSEPWNRVLPEALEQSRLAIERTVMTLKALFAQDVSASALGGPLMIYDMTSKAAEMGWAWLLKISAFISINLAVFNLLPLPVLDGGQIVVNGIEAIRRKPLSPRFLERFQQAGLLLIIGLMLFVTWNDIGRYIQDLTP